MGEKSRVARVPQPKPPAIFSEGRLLQFAFTGNAGNDLEI